MLTQNHNLDMTPNGVPIVVNASQYDVGREIHFYLYNGSEVFTPTAGSAIRIEGTKPDNTGFSYSASWTDNIVTVTLTDQMTVLAGEVKCELRVTLGGDDVGSLNFILLVEKAALNSNIPISDTEIPAIIQLARTEQYNAEAWAIGTRNGVPVTSDDETYQNNSKWYSEHPSNFNLDNLTDVTITTPSDGQSLIYDANSSEWVNGASVNSIDDLTDVTITSATDGQALLYDANSSEWVNGTVSTVGSINDLSDVTITTPTDGQVLSYDDDSSKWVNANLATVATTGDYSDLNNKPSLATVATTGDYSDLSNTPTIPTVDQTYDGTSANAQSGVAVASAVAPKMSYNEYSELGVKNLFNLDIDTVKSLNTTNYTWNNNSVSRYGITVTINEDGTLTVNGTATDNFILFIQNNIVCENQILNGCPSGGTDSTYKLILYASGNSKEEYGSGVTITDTVSRQMRLIIYNGYVATDLVFKPMLRLSGDTDPTYQPYAKTNKQLTDNVTDIETAIAPIEIGTASQAYAVGDYLIMNDTLYKVTQAIANGGTITVNTNVSQTSVADELKETYYDNLITNLLISKRNNMVYLSSGSNSLSASAFTSAVIPSGFRPSVAHPFFCYVIDGSMRYMGRGYIYTDGTILCTKIVNNANVSLVGTESIQLSTSYMQR